MGVLLHWKPLISFHQGKWLLYLTLLGTLYNHHCDKSHLLISLYNSHSTHDTTQQFSLCFAFAANIQDASHNKGRPSQNSDALTCRKWFTHAVCNGLLPPPASHPEGDVYGRLVRASPFIYPHMSPRQATTGAPAELEIFSGGQMLVTPRSLRACSLT